MRNTILLATELYSRITGVGYYKYTHTSFIRTWINNTGYQLPTYEILSNLVHPFDREEVTNIYKLSYL